MADPSYFSKGVVASLALVSGGTCYWPKPRCMTPVAVDINGDMVLNVEIAHIRGAHPNGPRYVYGMTDEERRQFGNLLLLCPSHHRVVDVIRRNDYSIAELVKWKRHREAGNYEVLKLLPCIDEDRLQLVITEALRLRTTELEEQINRFEAALVVLASIDREAATLIGQRMAAAEKLHGAARMLIHTEDTGQLLHATGMSLEHMPDTVDVLLSAAEEFSGLEDTVDLLGVVVNQWISIVIPQLNGACEQLSIVDSQLAQRIAQLQQMEGNW